jgi:hypothetical protein
VIVADEVTAETEKSVIPLPLTVNVCGLFAALSRMLKTALRVPVAPGVNITLMVQLEPPGKPLVQSFVWEKSAVFVPEKTMPLTTSMRSPVFVSEMTVGALGVETNCDEKVRLDGETDTAGGAVPRPVPVSAMVWGLAVALHRRHHFLLHRERPSYRVSGI